MKKENSRPLLSISLLSSGRNKTELTKCLKSLITIKNRMPAEIVAVDTGCDKESRQILQKYADTVVDFAWCDDFAKARNTGLKKCIGKWFMFIDDDEWFNNTDAIVEFFNSGEYRNYGCARYWVRNYLNLEGTKWTDFSIPRMVYITKETHFHGKIHEYLVPLYDKEKRIDSYVNHYGYVYKTHRELMIKSRRNVTPLREMIKEEPGNLRWRTQLVQEYIGIHDYGCLADACEEGIELVKDINDPGIGKVRTDFYTGMIQADNGSMLYEKGITDYKKYITDSYNTDICKASLNFLVAESYYGLEDYANTYLYAEKYEEIAKRVKQKEDFNGWLDSNSGLIDRDTFQDYNQQTNYARLLISAAKLADVNGFEKYFDLFDWTVTKQDIIFPLCESIVNMFSDNEFDNRFVYYAENMLKEGPAKAPFVYYCKQVESEIKDQDIDIDKKDNNRFEHLINVIGKTKECDDWYILYIRLRYYYLIHNKEQLINSYKQLVSAVLDIFNLDKSVWTIAEEEGINLTKIFKEKDYDSWKLATDSFIGNHFSDSYDIVTKLDAFMSGDNDIRFRYFRLKESEMSLVARYVDKKESTTEKHISPGYEEEDKEEIVRKESENNKIEEKKIIYGDIYQDLKDYCTECVFFYQDIYTSSWFSGDMTVLPPQCRFAVRFLNAIDVNNKIKSSNRIKEMEKCVDIYAPFNRALGEYIKEYGEREKTKLLQIQKNPELEKIYQMLDLLRQAMELQEKTGSEELQAGIMQQRNIIEQLLERNGITCLDCSKQDNDSWMINVNGSLMIGSNKKV